MAQEKRKSPRFITIIGSGTMGSQIGQVFAQKRRNAIIYDIDHNQLERAKTRILDNLERRLKNDKLSKEKKQKTLDNLEFTTDIQRACKSADLIIECVPENIDLKRKVFKQIQLFSTETCIIGSNSSTIGISKIVDGLPLEFRKRAMNIHFINPPLRIKLVELVKGEDTDIENVKFIRSLIKRMAYVPVIVKKEVPGFVLNRILGAVFGEMFRMLENEVISKEDLDLVCTEGLNWPLGVVRIADLVGLDVIYDSFQNVYEELKSDHLKPPKMLKDLVKKNELGFKTKKGLYDYSGLDFK